MYKQTISLCDISKIREIEIQEGIFVDIKKF